MAKKEKDNQNNDHIIEDQVEQDGDASEENNIEQQDLIEEVVPYEQYTELKEELEATNLHVRGKLS